MELPERIKSIRGIEKQEDFAKKLSVNKNTIGRWERGDQTPNADDLNKILEVYPDLSPAWLLTGEGEMKRGEQSPETVSGVNQELLEKVIEAFYSLEKDETQLTPIMMAQNIVFFYGILNHSRSKFITVEGIIKFMAAFSSMAEVATEHGFADDKNLLDMMITAIIEGDMYPGFEGQKPNKKYSETK